MKYLIRVKANHDCWISHSDGDPGRTLVKSNARIYLSRDVAAKNKRYYETQFPNRSYELEPLIEK